MSLASVIYSAALLQNLHKNMVSSFPPDNLFLFYKAAIPMWSTVVLELCN